MADKKVILNIILSIIEWIFFLGFLGISAFFLKDVLEKFSQGKGSISVSRDEITDQPTISFCFDFSTKMFDYGSVDLLSHFTKVKCDSWT